MIGMILGIPIAVFTGYPSFSIVLLMMLPMVLDGFLQLLTSYESKNYRRCATGIVFGIAFIFFLIYFHRICVMAAGAIVKLFVDDADKVNRAMELFL